MLTRYALVAVLAFVDLPVAWGLDEWPRTALLLGVALVLIPKQVLRVTQTRL